MSLFLIVAGNLAGKIWGRKFTRQSWRFSAKIWRFWSFGTWSHCCRPITPVKIRLRVETQVFPIKVTIYDTKSNSVGCFSRSRPSKGVLNEKSVLNSCNLKKILRTCFCCHFQNNNKGKWRRT